MQGKQFLYFLLNDADQSYYVDDMNTVQVSGVLRPLQFTPDGWQDISILTERNKKYFGLDRTYGAPQAFVEDAAMILKTISYTKAITEKVYLLILEQQMYIDATHFGYYYTKLCKCEIDLSQFVHDGAKVNETILDADVASLIKANETTVYDIPLDVPEAVLTQVDGPKLFATSNFQNLNISLQGNTAIGHWVPFTFISKDGDSVNVLSQNTSINGISTPFIKSLKGTTTVHLKGKLQYRVELILNYVVKLHKVTDTSIVADLLVHENDFTGGSGFGTDTYDFDLTVDLAEGEGLIWESFNFPNSPGAAPEAKVVYTKTDMTASYSTRLEASLVASLTAYDLYKAIIKKVTNGKAQGVSTLLPTIDPFVTFSSGDGCRLIKKAFIKTSLSEFFDFINMEVCAGLGVVDGKVALERKQFWCNNSNEIDLGEGSDLKSAIANDYLFSNVKFGYPNKLDNVALGNINGRYEFCMTHQYTTPNTRSTITLDVTTKYLAGMYSIENIRLNTEGKTTTDGSSDNDTIVFNVLPTIINPGRQTVTLPGGIVVTFTPPSYYVLDRSINSYAAGLLDAPTAYNLRLSPKQCLLRNGSYLRSCLENMESGFINFTTADKNVSLKVTLPSGQVIDERGNVQVSQLDAPFFKARIFTVTVAGLPASELASPQRRFKFTYKGGRVTLFGYDIKTGTQPADERHQTFQLLASADSDLSQLINVTE